MLTIFISVNRADSKNQCIHSIGILETSVVFTVQTAIGKKIQSERRHVELGCTAIQKHFKRIRNMSVKCST